MDPNSFLYSLNSSKYLIAVAMLLLNVGGRYIEIDLANSQRRILSSKLLRRILIFTVAFMATRDIVTALVITSCFAIFVLHLFNDESDYCILPRSFRHLDRNNDNELSPEEIRIAYEKLKKAGKIK